MYVARRKTFRARSFQIGGSLGFAKETGLFFMQKVYDSPAVITMVQSKPTLGFCLFYFVSCEYFFFCECLLVGGAGRKTECMHDKQTTARTDIPQLVVD